MSISSPGTVTYSGNVFFNGAAYDTVVAGTWQRYAASGYLAANNNTGGSALNDAISYKNVGLQGGTYTFRLWYDSNNSFGKVHLLIDGVDVGSIDTYTAGAATASTNTIASITVATGLHTIQLKAASKNASSSGYNIYIDAWQLVKTA